MRARVLASVLAVNAAMVSPSSARVCWISCRVWSKLLLSGGVLMTVSDSLRHVSSRRRLARCLWLLLFIPLAGPAPSGSTDTPGFVGAAPTLPGTSRVRLPSAPPPYCDRVSGEGLSPPLETTAPHGAHVRDVTFREDLHQARTGTGPAVIATLRNTAIGYHRTNGDTNIARATRRANRRPHDLITTVTSSYSTTQ